VNVIVIPKYNVPSVISIPIKQMLMMSMISAEKLDHKQSRVIIMQNKNGKEYLTQQSGLLNFIMYLIHPTLQIHIIRIIS
jgi:hypothetical protein